MWRRWRKGKELWQKDHRFLRKSNGLQTTKGARKEGKEEKEVLLPLWSSLILCTCQNFMSSSLVSLNILILSLFPQGIINYCHSTLQELRKSVDYLSVWLPPPTARRARRLKITNIKRKHSVRYTTIFICIISTSEISV